MGFFWLLKFFNTNHNTITLVRYLFDGISLFLTGINEILAHFRLYHFCPTGALSFLLGAEC